MLFNSITFAIFCPIVFVLYWAMPCKCRWIILLGASYYFYMSWNPKYVFLILLTTVISYVAGRLLEHQNDTKVKKLILAVAACVCLGVLFFFKYFNFVTGSIASVMSAFAIRLNPLTVKVLLPVGISFYTFQTLSYVIDVYRGEIEAERHFGYYATFIAFFPQLVAGPIERTKNLLPQIKEHHTFDYDQATYGMKLMAWGFFKKIFIADTLAAYVSVVYDAPKAHTGFALVLATIFFTFQIYCDFSGYSDIAIGTAKLLGINLMTNFKSPYFSQSIKEFWSRWHISLSTWFRDYVYIPLGGNRVGRIRHSVNLMLTFLASGLWHGANWTFVVWGGVHGLAQVIENTILPKRNSRSKGLLGGLRVSVVFCFAAVAWVFFVSASIGDAMHVLRYSVTGIREPLHYITRGFSQLGMRRGDLLIVVIMLLLLAIYDYLSLTKDVLIEFGKMNKIVRWIIYVLIALIFVFLSPKGVAAEFVYFQF